MITFFTTAKPFVGLTKIHQYNAIKSWKALHPQCDIILFGNGEGYETVVKDLGLYHVPNVASSELGTPRIDSMVSLAKQYGRNSIQAYVNCDVMLFPDFVTSIQRIYFSRFLFVGRRCNLDVDENVDCGDHTAAEWLKDRARREGELFTAWGIDYFAYRGEVWGALPQMVVGRAGYDNWLVYRAMVNRVPVVDAGESVLAIHQNHDYSHLEGGERAVFESGCEVLNNFQLIGDRSNLFSLDDVDWQLTSRGIKRFWCKGDSKRCREVFQIIHRDSKLCLLVVVGFVVEAYYEFRIRFSTSGFKRVNLLIKYIPWLARRLIK